MCGPDAPKQDNSSVEAFERERERDRRQEAARQRRIDTGERIINHVFRGGTVRTGQKEVRGDRIEVPKIERRVVTTPRRLPTGNGQDDGGAATGGDRRIVFDIGDKTFKDRDKAVAYRKTLPKFETSFEPVYETYEGQAPLLEQRREALRSYYRPQLQEQYEEEQDLLASALARNGLVRSTVAADTREDLRNAFARRSAEVTSTIQNGVDELRANLADEKSAAVSALRASGDRDASVQQAVAGFNRAGNEAPRLDPIVGAFSGIADGIGAIRRGFDTGDLTRRVRASSPTLSIGGGGRIVS